MCRLYLHSGPVPYISTASLPSKLDVSPQLELPNQLSWSTSMDSVLPMPFCLHQATKSSMTLGHAPSSLQNDKLSSDMLLSANSSVMFHMSLLTERVHFSPRNVFHRSSQSWFGVF